MRNARLLAPVVIAVTCGVAFAAAAGGHAARKPGLPAAVQRTVEMSSARYRIHVRITHGRVPLALHIRGQRSTHTISVAMRLSAMRLSDGTKVPGPDGAALIDGPFLYERAPSTIMVNGHVRWLRLRLATLSPHSADLAAVHAMTPSPVLRALAHARIVHAADDRRVYHGTIGYDNAAVRGLAKLTGGLQFRGLRISATVGQDGLVHRIVLTGHTADGQTTLSLNAHLFAFGKPVHVTPPAPGTFIDKQLADLTA